MTVKMGSLVVTATFNNDSSNGGVSRELMESLALAEKRILEQEADMISEAAPTGTTIDDKNAHHCSLQSLQGCRFQRRDT